MVIYSVFLPVACCLLPVACCRLPVAGYAQGHNYKNPTKEALVYLSDYILNEDIGDARLSSNSQKIRSEYVQAFARLYEKYGTLKIK